MDPNTAMETLGEGAKAMTKLGEIVGKFISPWLTRKQADADAYADQKKLEVIRNNPDMEIAYIDGEINARQLSQKELAFRAEQRLIAESIRQETNIEKVLEYTKNELQSAESVSDESVDDDWIVRFFNIAKDISNEEMQYVWGRILAGEITSPKSFSLKTLDVIRNINADDAGNFQKIIPFITRQNSYYFISADNVILSKYGISFPDLLSLDECGLINVAGAQVLTFQVTQNEYAGIINDETLIVVYGNENKDSTVRINIYGLTKAGKEIYQILPHSSNNDYMIDFARHIFNSGGSVVKTFVYRLVSHEHTTKGEEVQFSTTPIISFGENCTD